MKRAGRVKFVRKMFKFPFSHFSQKLLTFMGNSVSHTCDWYFDRVSLVRKAALKKNLPVHVKRWRTRETQWKCTMRMHQIGKSVPGLQLTYTFIGVCCQPHRERVTIFTPNLKHDTFMRYRRQVETGEQWNSVPLLSSDNKKKASWKMEPKSIVTGSVNDGERLDAVLGFMFFR